MIRILDHLLKADEIKAEKVLEKKQKRIDFLESLGLNPDKDITYESF